MFNDHKSYYSILGVQPGGTAALIKAAYRVRIMEVHPDRNTSDSATRETQHLNEAYAVLSDEFRRREYDATCLQINAEPRQPTARPADQKQTTNRTSDVHYQRNEPVRCSFCQAITLRPRYRELITVFSYLLASSRRTRRGIFCVTCERKYSAFATGVTLLLGWWSLYGFFRSFDALFKNLTGSWRFGSQDATLSCAQAFYFTGKGKLDLAHAIAVDALNLARSSKLTSEELRRKSLGYEPRAGMLEIKTILTDLIVRTERAGFTKELVRQPRLRQPSFLIQAALIGVLCIVLTLVWLHVDAENERATAESARIEQVRLEREGLARQEARVIAARQAEELRKLEQLIPSSGLFNSSLPRSSFRSQIGLPGLRVHAPAGTNYFLKLSELITGEQALTIFVRGGDTVDVEVPFGTYRVRMASGTSWYGEKVRFGPHTAYSQIDQPLTFSVEGNRLEGHELQLSLVRNGNLRPSQINADQF